MQSRRGRLVGGVSFSLSLSIVDDYAMCCCSGFVLGAGKLLCTSLSSEIVHFIPTPGQCNTNNVCVHTVGEGPTIVFYRFLSSGMFTIIFFWGGRKGVKAPKTARSNSARSNSCDFHGMLTPPPSGVFEGSSGRCPLWRDAKKMRLFFKQATFVQLILVNFLPPDFRLSGKML